MKADETVKRWSVLQASHFILIWNPWTLIFQGEISVSASMLNDKDGSKLKSESFYVFIFVLCV